MLTQQDKTINLLGAYYICLDSLKDDHLTVVYNAFNELGLTTYSLAEWLNEHKDVRVRSLSRRRRR